MHNIKTLLRTSLVTLFTTTLVLSVGIIPAIADAGPPWAGTTLDDLAYTEGDGWVNLDPDVTVTSDTNDFTDGYVEVDITNASGSDALRLVDGGLVTVVGNAVFYDGDRIGTIDNNYDGSAGRLRINFSATAPLWNADFESGDLSGWTVNTGYLGVNAQPWVESPGADPDVNPSNVDSDPLVDDHCYGSCSYGPVTQTATVQSGVIFEKSYALQLTISGTVLEGYGTAHGPTVTSEPFTAAAGDTISLNWNAVQGGDWYDVYGFVFRDVNVNGIWDGGESYQKLFHDVGANTSGWITTTIPVNATVEGDNLRFFFLNGNYDYTGGRAIGSSLYIDGIVVTLNSVVVATDAIVENIIENIQYQNTSDDPATPKNYNLNFEESDNGTGFNSAQINITGTNDDPTDIALSNNNLDENQPIGTLVGTLSTTDPDSGDMHTYSLVAGAGSTDNALFAIVGNQLQTSAILDYETKSSYSIRVRTDDGNGGTYEEVFTITVNDINDAPSDLDLDNNDVDENQPAGTAVGSFSTTDQDPGDSHTYSLVSGTGDDDNGSFTIVGDELRTTAIFDHETKDTYSIRVQTNDGNGGTYQEIFSITINDINDDPTDLSIDSANVDENQPVGTSVGNFSTTDQDVGDSHTYSLVTGVGDADNSSFSIVGNQLRTAELFDYETKDSYSIRVQTDDGNGGILQEQFDISINDINDDPTDVDLSNNSVQENQPVGTVVGTLSTTDQDPGDSHTYSLVAGTGDADNASFSIVGNQLQTAEMFDYETKDTYSIRVQTSDGNGGTFEEAFTINVTGTNDDPTDIDLSSSDVDENQPVGTAVGTLSTTDQDPGDSHTYSLVSGTGDDDNASFTISGDTLQTTETFDFESKSSYSIRIQTDDGNGGTYQESFTITINDINDPPTDISMSSSDVDENQPVGTAVGDFSSTDQDAGDSHSYMLVAGFGDDDNASFTISGNTLQTTQVFDFESKSTYSIRVQTDDGHMATFEKVFTISINDINDAPTDIDLSSTEVIEKQPIGTVVGTLSTTDEDAGDSHTYSLVVGLGDDDNASFSISGNSLQTAEVFNYEVKDTYTIRIQTDDGNGGTYQESFTITIIDYDEGYVRLICSGGGNVRLGSWSLYVPPGALPQCSIVRITTKKVSDGPDVPETIARLGHTVDITVTTRDGDPITTFTKQLDVCFEYGYDDLYRAQHNPHIMIIGFYRADQTVWDVLVTLASLAKGEICSSVNHLSLFDVFVPLTPDTGFSRGRDTALPIQPVDKAYQQLGPLSLELPSLDLSMPIIGIPITDSGWDVTWLGNNIGYLEGTAFPTWEGNTVLTAHVWDADNTPGPFVGLKDLKYGEEVRIHAWGMVYTYEVRSNYRVWPNNHYLMRHEDYDWVTLLTCESFNEFTESYRYRRAVRAVLVEVRPE